MKKDLGILMHISSLPSKYGVGTLGKEAYEFVDFLKQNKLNLWQILPLNVTSFGDSPYQSPSNFGLNYYFIDLDILINKGLLKEEEISSIKFFDTLDRVNYEYQYNNRLNVLRIAYNRFDKSNKKFNTFLKRKDYRDFAFFMVLKRINNGRPWYQFDDEYKTYSKKLEAKIIKDYNDEFNFYMWTQFEFLNQFKALKRYANKNNIKIMGDMPIYVAYDSVECYKYPSMFQFNEFKEPTNVAGCPPDCFSEDGQLWGNPLWNWDNLKLTNYKWYKDRIKMSLKLFDYLRIDHFRGFSGYFSIPFKDKTARNGKWIKGPGYDLFKDLKDLPIIAEDLGSMDDEFYKFKDECGFPGMKIVDQALDNLDENSEWRPSNITSNYFVYASTHDSPTTLQFIEESDDSRRNIMLTVLKDECKKMNLKYIKDEGNNSEILEKIVELTFVNKGKASVIAMQDLLGIGKEGRMNFPSTLSTLNWSWRMKKEDFLNKKEKISALLTKCIDEVEKL